MMHIKSITIVKGITEDYSIRLSRNLFAKLERRVNEGTMSIIDSDKISATYKNLRPSSVDGSIDNDYVYIVDPLNDTRTFYKILPE